ncbi:MAG: FAD-binding protein [Bacteroidales bacterium]|nr:FAD-binding protein [Bacteroidales bacterium]
MITRHEAYDLSRRNTFGMKVSCCLYVEVTEPEDLLTLDFDALPQPIFVMGGGSNLLFTRDFPGTVLHMGNRFLHPSGVRNDREPGVRNDREPGVRNDGAFVIPSEAKESLVRIPAGVVFDDFCAWAAQEGLWGPENLSLIPGEVGASAVQNIGAYGVEAKDIIETVHAFDLRERRFVDIPAADCGYGYRTSNFKTVWKGRYIITAVTFRLSLAPTPVLDYGGVRKALDARFLDSDLSGSARNDRTTASAEEVASVISPKVEGPAPVIPSSAKESDVVMPDLIGHLTPRMIRETIIAIREKKLPDPAKVGSAGSFFCNPVISREHFERIVATAREENGPDCEVPHYEVGDRVKVPAAWMIDQCGFKGMRLGGAQVYPNQPLVIVNATGDATPQEIIALEQRVIDTIRKKYGIELHPEVEHVGAQLADNQRIK